MPVGTTAATNTNWVCSGLAIVILLIRAVLSRGTLHVTLFSKWICVVSLLVITARLPLVYFLMRLTAEGDQPAHSDAIASDTDDLQKTAVLALSTRILATTYFWLQAALLLRFYARIIGHIRWARRAITLTWVVFFTTFTAVILITMFECRPLRLYWSPEKVACQQARAQIFTQGIFNIVLDLALLVIVLPIVARAQLAVPQKLQIFGLLLLGTICIVVTGLKLKYVVGSNSSQAMRTFWASLGVVVSTFVANMPTIVGCATLKWPRHKMKDLGSDGWRSMPPQSDSTYYQKCQESIDLERKVDRQILKTVDVNVRTQDARSTTSGKSCARSITDW